MNDENTDEQVHNYNLLRTESQAAMRGMVNTFGIDKAIGTAANVYGATLEQIVALEGVMRAAYEAGQLAGVR